MRCELFSSYKTNSFSYITVFLIMIWMSQPLDHSMQLNQPEDTRQQMAVLSRSLKAYKRLRRNPNAAAALFDGKQPPPEEAKKVDRVIPQVLIC